MRGGSPVPGIPWTNVTGSLPVIGPRVEDGPAAGTFVNQEGAQGSQNGLQYDYGEDATGEPSRTG